MSCVNSLFLEMGLLGVGHLFYAFFWIVQISKSTRGKYKSWRLAYRSAKGGWERFGVTLAL